MFWISSTPEIEASYTIHSMEDNTCTCSSMHIQGRLTYTDTHRCPLHNDTMEHDCTVKNIVPGLIVPSDGQLDAPQPVEDRCVCSSLHVHGNLVNVCYYHRCPVHNDTLEHDCTNDNIVTGQANFVQVDKLPETNSTPEPVEDACICSTNCTPQSAKDACVCSTLHIQGGSAYKRQ